MKKTLWLILVASILSIAAHADYYTISFTGDKGTPPVYVPTFGSFDYDPTNPASPFSTFHVVWDGQTFDLLLGTNGLGANGANSPAGGGCGTPTTGAMAFGLMSQSLSACSPSGPYLWTAQAFAAPDGTQTFAFSYGPTTSYYALAIQTFGTCSVCSSAGPYSGTFSIQDTDGPGHPEIPPDPDLPTPTAPEPSTLGLLSTGLLAGIGILRRKLTL